MTRPTKSSAGVEGVDAHELPNSAPQLATTAETHPDDQQNAWLRAGPEVFHAPVTQSRSTPIIGLSALAVVVAGLAVATVVYFLAQDSPDRTGSAQITAPPTTASPQARPTPSDVLAAHPAPVIPPAPMATTVAPTTSPEAPVGPEAPVLTPAAPKPTEQVPAGTAERRSTSHREPLASTTRPPAPAPPAMTAARQPSGADGDQASAAQPTPTAPPCTDCTEPTLTRTPTSWTPQRP